MPLSILDQIQLTPIIIKAIQADLKTTAIPGDGGKHLVTDPGGAVGGLMGLLDDKIDPNVRFEDGGKRAKVQTLAVASAVVDNRNGKTPNSTVTLRYAHSKTQTQSHEVSHTFHNGLGAEVTAKAKIPFIADGGLKFSYDFSYEYKFSNAHSSDTMDRVTFTQSVPVKVPTGKVYKVVLTGTHQEATVQTHQFVNITGTCKAWFGHKVNGHFNWNYSAATLWRLIHDHQAAGGESGSYGHHGDDHGWISQHGEITGSQVINFRAHTEDITSHPHPHATAHEITSPVALAHGFLESPNIVETFEFNQ